MAVPASEWSKKFEQRARQSMEVSYHKYGPLKDAYPHKVNAIATLKLKLAEYEETGNADLLVDIRNYAMIEFMHPAHPVAHDRPKDGSSGRYWRSGGRATEKRNDGERARFD